jgi:hypothetical protein
MFEDFHVVQNFKNGEMLQVEVEDEEEKFPED